MDFFLKLKNITVSYDDRVILDNINYYFTKGIYVIRGESGVGKTTLLNTIAGYLPHDQGKIEYSTRAKLAYCIQEEFFFSNLTVKENLIIKSMGVKAEIDTSKIHNLLSKFGIEKHIDSKVFSLSGGEKQRLKMVMMLIDNPNIILLDEPTSMLDCENKKRLTHEIENAFAGQLLIISSHDALEFTDHVTTLTLIGGKINEI